jgi:hypothetical protein
MGLVGMGLGGMPLIGMAGQQHQQHQQQQGRSLYLAGVGAETTYHDVCKAANRFGPVESVMLKLEKGCAFINFLEGGAAAAMFGQCQAVPLLIRNTPIKVNWAKPTPLSGDVLEMVNHGATRNLHLRPADKSPLPESLTTERLRAVFASFGEFDSVLVKESPSMAFINFSSIRSAHAARESLNGTAVEGVVVKIGFAKEGLPGNIKKKRAEAAASAEDAGAGELANRAHGTPSRAVFLAGVPADTTYHDLFKVANLFGAVEQVRGGGGGWGGRFFKFFSCSLHFAPWAVVCVCVCVC